MNHLILEIFLIGNGGLLLFLFGFIFLYWVNNPCPQQKEDKTKVTPQTPQTILYRFPLLKSTFSFLFDGLTLFSFAS